MTINAYHHGGAIIKFVGYRPAFFLCSGWHSAEFGQSPQPQPQEDFPCFLSDIIFFATRASTISRIAATTIVPRLFMRNSGIAALLL